MKQRTMEQAIRKEIAILKFLLLIAVVAGVPLYLYFYHPDFFTPFRSMETANAFLAQYRTESLPIYFLLQIAQLLIPAIPGQFIQFAGGYLYSFWPAYPVGICGAAAGTSASFALSRFLGKDGVHLLFGKARTEQFVHQLNSKRAYIVLFVLFLLPGFPKDFIAYAAGISEIRLKPFLLLSLIGRTPAMMVTIMMGSMLRTQSYTGMIVLGTIAAVAFIFCLIRRKALLRWIDRIYERILK